MGEHKMSSYSITWTGRETAGDGTGDTRYHGVVDGERLFTIEGSGNPNDRRFRAFRLNSDDRPRPVGHGGAHRRLWQVQEDCARELAESTNEQVRTWVGNMRERRELVATLRHLNADREAHRMSLPELREAVTALRDDAAVEAADEREATRTGGTFALKYLGPRPSAPHAGELLALAGVTAATHVVTGDGHVIPRDGLAAPYGSVADMRSRYESERHSGDDLRTELARAVQRVDVALSRAEAAERDRRELRLRVEKLSRPLADVLRKLRDDHLPMWLRACIENDEARQLRDRETDPEAYPLHADDVRTMIADVAREIGIAL